MSQLPVELRDQLNIDTPELVQLEFSVAGLGSRSLACLFDYFLQGVGWTLLILGLVWLVEAFGGGQQTHSSDTSSPSGVWVAAILLLIFFLVQWGYFSLFEAFWNGQTPGKRLFRLRVIEKSGRSINFLDALTRNLLRAVDMMPGFYIVGIVFLFTTRRCQRLGDMVAGTIVIHERKVAPSMWNGNGARTFTAALTDAASAGPAMRPTGLPADVVAKLTLADVEVIESFEARRLDLPVPTGEALAAKLAAQMAARMNVALPTDRSVVDLLAGLAHERRSMGR
jgi:uncharacterized RDD family membrane protein YckC